MCGGAYGWASGFVLLQHPLTRLEITRVSCLYAANSEQRHHHLDHHALHRHRLHLLPVPELETTGIQIYIR